MNGDFREVFLRYGYFADSSVWHHFVQVGHFLNLDCIALVHQVIQVHTSPRFISSKYFSATSSNASCGHSVNQSIVVQLTNAGYCRMRFLKKTNK